MMYSPYTSPSSHFSALMRLVCCRILVESQYIFWVSGQRNLMRLPC